MVVVGVLVVAGSVPAFAPVWVGLVGVPVWVLAYFTVGYVCGGTLGMRAASITALGTASDRRLGLGRALARAVLALVAFLAFFSVFAMFGFSDRPSGGYTLAYEITGTGAVALCLLTVCGDLGAVIGHRHATLQDWVVGITRVRPTRVRADDDAAGTLG